MQSLKKNFIYNAILTMSGYIFPLMVYPYVSRVLGVANIGACNFVDSIVEYFTILSMMGMNTIGIREIAKCKNDQQKLDNVFSQLFSLNTLTTITAIIILIIATNIVPKFAPYKDLLYIGVGKLFFNYMLINWFFQGLENFKYIAARTIFVKILFVISVFLFVKTETDVKLYYFLVALTWAGNGIINFIYAKKYVSFNFTLKINKAIIGSFFILGVYWFMNSMYTTLNVAFLGFATNDIEVGYYTTANKLLTVIMTMFTALTSVMVPRVSVALKSNDNSEAKALIRKSINALMLFAIPLIFFVFPFSQELIYLMSGKGYEGATTPLQIMTPLFFLVGYDQIIVLQTLLPMGKDKDILRNSILAASVGIISNIFLTLNFGKNGSAIVLILAELSVLLSSQFCVTKYLGLKIPFKLIIKHIIGFSPIIIICYVIKYFINSYVISLIVSASIICCYIFLAGRFILKNSILTNLKTPLFK
ncbi:flippase [Segatella copri]|uniref:flippase n=1 Tax=Segatella copri TaxID=165179 RepID=UPI0029161CDB|nr:flippase [Segatella copri]MDV3121337.1 flippase [Segatella copri]